MNKIQVDVYYGIKELYDSFVIESEEVSRRGRIKYKLDCAFVWYLVKEIRLGGNYRKCFAKSHNTYKVKIYLQPTSYDLIDYKWNDYLCNLVRERCELDHALSWLSTLGGAFSALGDYFSNCAERAGKISVSQMRLALKLNDPSITSRCRLYYSLSMIQQKKFKLAKNIIYHEYKQAKESVIKDERLLKMCKGIWSKLQYEHKIKHMLPQKMNHFNIKK